MKLRLHLFLLLMFAGLFSFAQITTVGVIGDATPGGWDNDTDMTQDKDSMHLWTATMTLKSGFVKFRANNDWAVNWGPTKANKDSGFPIGVGVQDGKDIPVYPGDYFITFNSNTGAYYLDVDSDIGIIGDATPGGWDNDTDMYIDPTDTNKYYNVMVLKTGAAKFRQNDSWDVNWGSLDYPSGIGTQGGKDIPIPSAGTYTVKFDKSTGAYSFEEKIEFASIGIIGTATPGMWDTETSLTKDGANPDLWKGRVALTVGEAKFRANNAWAISWGSPDFPKGIAGSPGENIKVNEAGTYQIYFNTKTGEYDFQIIKPYATIGIIGTATPGMWATDTDMEKDANDPTIWRLRMKLTEGEAKFRADNAWDVSWGGDAFPKGIASGDAGNLQVTAGDYKITFNTLTLEYNFEAVVEFSKISVVGNAGPFGEWPGSDDSKDTYMDKDPANPNHWTLSSITLTDTPLDGGVKFRAETAWAKNWGAKDFPIGVGVQNGKNIECTAGTYKVDFKSDTGEYGFADPNATYDILSDATISVYPNPTASFINIVVKEDAIKGADTKVTVYDNGGRVVYTNKLALDRLSIDASRFNTGNYFIQLTSNKYIVGKQVSVIK